MLAEIEAKMEASCARTGRMRSEVLLVAVSKSQHVKAIAKMYERGLRDFGENRVQELLRKRESLPANIRWHFIGNLQSNKVKYLAPFVHSVHSVNSQAIALELSKRAKEAKRTIPILIEVNMSYEAQKQGMDPGKVEDLVLFIAQNCTDLSVSGLMGMASFEENPENTRPQFRKLRELRDKIRERHPELKSFKELSMGMSNDFEVAIEEGATIVRIGSALFEGDH